MENKGSVNRGKSGSPERDAKGRFVKGNKSGGRPERPPEFKAFVKVKSLVALRRVAEILESKTSDPKDVLTAAKLIIEYAYGKPAQSVTADVRQQMGGDFILKVLPSGQGKQGAEGDGFAGD